MMKISEMPKYDDYVDSGVEWLGRVPASWELTRLGTRFNERRSKVSDIDYPALSVTKKGVLPQLDNAAKTKDGDNRKLVKEGDFVINSRSDRKGSSGVSDRDGSVSLINIVLKPKGIHPKFSEHLLKSHAFIEEYYRVGRGIVADLWTTRYDEMRTITISVPSLEEQTRIANFLDKKTALIDEAISIKEQQISLLKERKQIIIQQAVTQGLDPNVPMKDSGVDWIGKIPAHWDIVPGFTVFKEGKDSNKGMIESQVLSLSYGNVIIKPEEKLVGLVPESFETYQIALPGDIIIRCTDLQNDKTSLRTGIVRNKGIITSAYLNLRLKTEHSAEFMHYFLHVLDITKTIYRFGSGLRQNLSYKDFKHMRILMPPKAEQIEIVNYINNQVEVTESSIDLIKNKIEKLKEYKTTLINSAVTGKIKITPEMVEQ
ncbi:restriction endonuclease subunit S [Escherichia coli]|uniref:restriction endonuclease subunit S n=1 Tax=Escherichia coli TaxID=562 RepID=UPI001FF2946D|nr:restriction endonuclease subunit S [Escherichia coli]